MQAIIESLEKNLQCTAQVFGKMLDLSKKKQDSIVRGCVRELEEIDRDEQKLLQFTNLLGQERGELQGAFHPLVGASAEQPTLRQIAEGVEDPYATRLLDARKDLLSLATQLGETNRVNAMLVSQSLDFANEVLARTVGKPTSQMTYTRLGMIQTSDLARTLVNTSA